MSVVAFLTATSLSLILGCAVMFFSSPLLYFENDIVAVVAVSLGAGLIWGWIIAPEWRSLR